MDSPPTKKRRKGGQRQRMNIASKQEDTGLQTSKLANLLLERWAWGEISPQNLQATAAAVVADFEASSAKPPSDLAVLANLGSHGRHPNKMHQELLHFANKGCSFSKPFSIKMGFKQPWAEQFQTMLLPHVVFSDLFHHYPDAFQQYVCASDRTLVEFWQLQKQHPAYPGHPVSQAGFQASNSIPLAMHGDGTPAIGVGKIWARMLTSYSWCSLVCQPAWTKDSQFPIWFVFDECDQGDSTSEFFTILSWSFKALQTGLWPAENHLGEKYSTTSELGKLAGQPLAGGYKGVLWSLVGDMEYFNQKLHLPHYALLSGPCCLCRCKGDESDESWRDCRLSAKWVSMQWTAAEQLGWFRARVLFFSCA